MKSDIKQKVVLSVAAYGDEEKRKVLQAITSSRGIDQISTDKDGNKLRVTVVGTMDPIDLGNKLSKHWKTNMVEVVAFQDEKTAVVAKKINQEKVCLPDKNDRGKNVEPRNEPEKQAAEVRVREYEARYHVIKK